MKISMAFCPLGRGFVNNLRLRRLRENHNLAKNPFAHRIREANKPELVRKAGHGQEHPVLGLVPAVGKKDGLVQFKVAAASTRINAGPLHRILDTPQIEPRRKGSKSGNMAPLKTGTARLLALFLLPSHVRYAVFPLIEEGNSLQTTPAASSNRSQLAGHRIRTCEQGRS